VYPTGNGNPVEEGLGSVSDGDESCLSRAIGTGSVSDNLWHVAQKHFVPIILVYDIVSL
jgi:hypothetical protein